MTIIRRPISIIIVLGSACIPAYGMQKTSTSSSTTKPTTTYTCAHTQTEQKYSPTQRTKNEGNQKFFDQTTENLIREYKESIDQLMTNSNPQINRSCRFGFIQSRAQITIQEFRRQITEKDEALLSNIEETNVLVNFADKIRQEEQLLSEKYKEFRPVSK